LPNRVRSVWALSSAKQLFTTTTTEADVIVETVASSNTQSRSGNRQAVNILPKQSSDAGCSFNDTLEVPQSLLTERQQQLITQASNTRYPTVLADILAEHCPTVVNSFKKLICKDIRKSCEKLCRRSQGSVLCFSHLKPRAPHPRDIAGNLTQTKC
jgi:hypothetical protein